MVLGFSYFQKSSLKDFKELPLQRTFHEESFIYKDGSESVNFKLGYILESSIFMDDLKIIYLVFSKMIPSSVSNEDIKAVSSGFKNLKVDAKNDFSKQFANGSAYKSFAFSHSVKMNKILVTGNFSYSCLDKKYSFKSPLAPVFDKSFISEKFYFQPFNKLSLESLLRRHKKRFKVEDINPLSSSRVARSYRDLLDYARFIYEMK